MVGKILIFILMGVFLHPGAYSASVRSLRFGTQSVTLTSDKRSAPALAVQMPEGDIWYGFLTSGTAPGRLTVQMPPSGNQWPGQVFSLIAATNHTFSDIQADFPRIYTWNGSQVGLPNRFGNQSVSNFNSTSWDANLSIERWGLAAIYPTYWVQATCSATAGTYAVKGNPAPPYTTPLVASPNAAGNTVFGSTERHCWCRLKQRADGANGGWVFIWALSTAA